MASPGVYRRALPSPPAIEFASPEGKKIFAEALGQGTMEGFFKLISYYQTQSEPAYCGLATLTVVLNALAIDPGRKWKGPWRWFDDSMLDCCEPLAKIKSHGITFGKVACLARCNGAKVEAFRSDESTVHDFRNRVISSCSSEDFHVTVSYHRKAFNQTGSGHFSPLGGYHAERDMVLILDVARFKYPPHWVPLTLLWNAMNTIDEATGHHRGYMIVSRFNRAPSILYTVSCRHEGWSSVAKFLAEDVPLLIKSEDLKEIQEVLSVVFKSPPSELRGFITWVAEVRRQEDGNPTLSEEERGRLAIKAEVLEQIRTTALFTHVTRWLDSECSCCNSISKLGDKDMLPALAASVCCQGENLLSGYGRLGLSGGKCCSQIDVKHLNVDGENPVTLVSGTVTTGGSNEQGVDVLVPLCQRKPNRLCLSNEGHCIGMHPSTADVLTVLLLALPLHTWSGIKEEKLRVEFTSLLTNENLPPLLQEEVTSIALEHVFQFFFNIKIEKLLKRNS
ncbi:glutathione gamma-glutamylcysteinyltransferase 3-like isoform X2 [Gastrolobium bilobum]|uniref:glutathione gamma-glutamylcysteinyltransferase 3-like isoform X2 n=1 Tax=Gastrolobium bilobum TaxID=150636 RepID=UPI002AB110D5|nr:glutathione gamma-glutamylcysteinyltransferase 3-like isoform X2 [Gastrolobium bilobum]